MPPPAWSNACTARRQDPPARSGGRDRATLAGELDLQREGANASVLRRFWDTRRPVRAGSDLEPHRARADAGAVSGIPSDDLAALDAAGIDRKALAAKSVRVFYTQVFRDNFFHADAHAGNIWVGRSGARARTALHRAGFRHHRPAVRGDQYYLAENFMAIFNRDYRRIAELHVQAAGCRPRCASTIWKRPCARCASRTSPGRQRDLAGRSAGQAVPYRAEVPAHPAAAADPAAEDPAQHRRVGPPARPADRHLGGGAPGAGSILRRRYSPRRLVREFVAACRKS
jgi:ubiquinone biosynthesis protein